MKRQLFYGVIVATLVVPIASAFERDASISLRSIMVIDDCDNVSQGDWIIAFSGVQMRDPEAISFSVFPSINRSVHVSSGHETRINRSISLERVPVGEEIQLAVTAVDCDTDGQSLPGYFLIPGFPISVEGTPELDRRPIPPWGLPDCDGEEEVLELSGNDDNAGSAALRLVPNQWARGGQFQMIPIDSQQCFEGRIELGNGVVGEPGAMLPSPGTGVVSEPGGFDRSAYTATISIDVGPVRASAMVPVVMMMTE